jgi:hypothetical protein
MAQHASALCKPQGVGVIEYDGALMRMRALEGFNVAAAERMRQA